MNPSLARILAVLAVSLVFVNGLCPDVDGNKCNNKGSCIKFPNEESYCSCHSGYGGADCASFVGESCDFLATSMTSSSNPPKSVLADFDAGQLILEVVSPLILERTQTILTLGQNNNDNCTYPGRYWSHTFSGCADKFYGRMPWFGVNYCGWKLSEVTADSMIYENRLSVKHIDMINPFAERPGTVPIERSTEHTVPIQVEVPLDFQL